MLFSSHSFFGSALMMVLSAAPKGGRTLDKNNFFVTSFLCSLSAFLEFCSPPPLSLDERQKE